MPRLTRIIRVGQAVVTAPVCEICPQQPAIWPKSAFDAHIAGHKMPVEPRAKAGLAPVNRYRGGRPTGARNYASTSLKRESIRAR